MKITPYQKSQINAEFARIYELEIQSGEHGHWESMFTAMHQAYAQHPYPHDPELNGKDWYAAFCNSSERLVELGTKLNTMYHWPLWRRVWWALVGR